MTTTRDDTTQMLIDASRGGSDAVDQLIPLVYAQLREIAGRYLRRERRGHILQPTALVHEAYLKLVDGGRVDLKGRTHFLAIAARQMREILIDHARLRDAGKRGGDRRKVTLSDSAAVTASGQTDVVTLHNALIGLARKDPRAAEVVELRFFGGLSEAEVAEVLGVSVTTIEGDWRHARAWLRRELSRGLTA